MDAAGFVDGLLTVCMVFHGKTPRCVTNGSCTYQPSGRSAGLWKIAYSRQRARKTTMIISIEGAKKMIHFLADKGVSLVEWLGCFFKQRRAIAWQIDHNNQKKNERKP